MKPTDIQQDCINKMGKLKVGAIFMGMGMGKTYTICKILETKPVNKVLYLCPKSLVETTKKLILSYEIVLPDIRFEGIDSISMSDKLFLDLINWVDENTAIVVDESSWIKNYCAKRTKRILELSQKTCYKFVLSGTPVTRTSVDLFTQYTFLSPKILGYKTWAQFEKHHVEYDRKNGEKNISNVLNEKYLVERIKPFTFQANDELDAEKKYFVINYEMCDETRYLYQKVKEDFFKNAINIDYLNIFVLFTKLTKILSCYKKNVVAKKVVGNSILFTRFNVEQQEYKGLLDCELLNGRTDKKVSLENWFDKKNVLVANIQVGAFGHNFQHCNKMFFATNTFDWALREQAEKRIHRFGQKNVCEYYDFICSGTIEDHMKSCIGKKQKLVETVWELCSGKTDDEKKQLIGGFV